MPRHPWVPLPEEAPLFHEIYIDESSQNSKHHLAIGGIICPRDYAQGFADAVIAARGSELPVYSADGESQEIKWTKVSRAKLDAYKRVVLCFFQFANKIPLTVGRLDFHSTVVDATLKTGRINEIGFNAEIRALCLKYARLYKSALFHVYLDERTTSHKLWKERNHLNNLEHKKRPNKNWPYRRMMFRNSRAVQGLQVADVLLGALTFRLNGHYDQPGASPPKIELSDYVMKLARISDPFRDTKHLARYTIWHRDKPWLKPMLKASRSPSPR